MEQFQYRTLVTNADEGFLGGKLNTARWEQQLNDMGARGWELVSTVSTAQGHGSTRWVISVLKRRVRQPQGGQ